GALAPPGPAAVAPSPPAVDPLVEVGDVGADRYDHEDHGHTVTVGRPVVEADEPTGAGGREVTTRRVVLGTVAGVVCLLAVAVSLLVFGRGGDEVPPTTTGPLTTQLLELQPPTPESITVAPAAEPGTVVVSWTAVGEPGDGISYQVRPQTDDAPPQNTDQLSVTFQGIAAGARPCYKVVAIAANGRTSDESTLSCL
ncbi:MAG: hypothetical protein ABW122_02945, partial [Ilumatobacteraceae bacterium]